MERISKLHTGEELQVRQRRHYKASFISNPNKTQFTALNSFRSELSSKRKTALSKVTDISQYDTNHATQSVIHFRHPRNRSVRLNTFPRPARVLPNNFSALQESQSDVPTGATVKFVELAPVAKTTAPAFPIVTEIFSNNSEFLMHANKKSVELASTPSILKP